MSNICIVVLVGIPGAGKTNFYKFMSDNLHLENTNISYISYDEHEKCMERTIYKNFRSKVHDKVDSLLNQITENNSKDNELIIIDDNMFYRSMRRSYYNLARKYTAGFCEIFLNTNVDVAIDRNSERTTDRVPTNVIIEMHTKLEPPSKDNLWETNSCEINSEKDYTEEDVKIVGDLIQDAMKNPVEIEEQIDDFLAYPKSLIQNVDLMLRKLVGRNIKNAILANKPQLTIEVLSQELLLRKKSIMDGVKSNELFFEQCADENQLDNVLSKFLENIEVKAEEEIPSKKLKLSFENGSDKSDHKCEDTSNDTSN